MQKQIDKCGTQPWLNLIHPTSTWTYRATLRRHSCLLRAATSASSQVSPIPRRSFLTIPLQFVLGRPGPLLKPGTWASTVVKYLDVYLASAKMFTCATDNAKKSFYRSFNGIFGKIGREASEHVVVELLKTKCLPVSLFMYGLEVCSHSKAQIRSLDYAVSSCYMKICNLI